MKSGFWDKLIDRLDKLDPESLQTHFLRLARERGFLETVFQSIQEGVIVIDTKGRLSYANSAAERLVGVKYKSAKGRHISRYLREIDWDRILTLDETEWSKIINREIEVTYPEHRFVNFYIVPLQPEKQPLRERRTESSSDEASAVVILSDVTHQREREASVLESEKLNAVKLLAAGVAHEIGNPLNALNIHLQLLDREIGTLLEDSVQVRGKRKEEKHATDQGIEQSTLNDEKVDDLKGLVDVARKEVSRLDLIIAQFLRAIRPSLPELVTTSIEDLLKDTLTLLEQEVQNRSIKVELDCSKKVPKIAVDRDQLKQVFFNLIRNSFQAMPDGGELTITLSSNEEFLEISFRDTGKGIKSEDFAQIFEPYHTTKEKGSGLGLMIVQRIIQDHGGQIEVASKEGEGSNFTIQLPIGDKRTRLLEGKRKESNHEE